MERKEWSILTWIIGIFAVFYFVPYQSGWFNNSIVSGVNLLNEYAKQHVLTCLVPALFIAGAIGVFIKKDAVLKYLGPKATKWKSYGIASISGAILAVCSCTILPLFAGIRKRGAGIGPAITFLFSGPAINIAAIFMTMSVLGFKIGIARVSAAILLSILVGLSMALIFREKIAEGGLFIQKEESAKISKYAIGIFFALMVGILIVNGLQINQTIKYYLMGLLSLGVVGIAAFKLNKKTVSEWLNETWSFSKLILPLLFIGVFVAGFIMPLLPESIITHLVGSNTIIGNVIASIFGAFMYFSTLTEIPILQALMTKGMHSGPALALLLAGPSLSLPNMLVVRGVLGTKKTAVYVGLVIIYATIGGLIFGSII
ncbi:MAG: permease [Nanoarchaeota archaeon]|nr:permease [Nanoarchaeota archaeon]MBU1854293.1 permease [Nanoarchaeota archaeon]